MLPLVSLTLFLPLVGAVLIVLTLPDVSESPPAEQTSIPADREPFQLSDGNTYVEHAGMAVEVSRIRCMNVSC